MIKATYVLARKAAGPNPLTHSVLSVISCIAELQSHLKQLHYPPVLAGSAAEHHRTTIYLRA